MKLFKVLLLQKKESSAKNKIVSLNDKNYPLNDISLD